MNSLIIPVPVCALHWRSFHKWSSVACDDSKIPNHIKTSFLRLSSIGELSLSSDQTAPVILTQHIRGSSNCLFDPRLSRWSSAYCLCSMSLISPLAPDVWITKWSILQIILRREIFLNSLASSLQCFVIIFFHLVSNFLCLSSSCAASCRAYWSHSSLPATSPTQPAGPSVIYCILKEVKYCLQRQPICSTLVL